MTFLQSNYQYLCDATWLPDIFKVASGVMTLSTMLRGMVYIQPGAKAYYPNLYCMLVGESNSGKGIAIEDTSKAMIRKIKPDLVLNDRYTPEGLLKDLAERGDKAKGTVFNDELETLISGKKYMSGMAVNMIGIYNNTMQAFDIRYANDTYKINEPYVGVFSGVQPDIISRLLNVADASSGFIPRWWICRAKANKRKRTTISTLNYDDALLYLRILDEAIQQTKKPIRIPIEDGAEDYLFEVSEWVKESHNDNRCFARLPDLIYKLGIIYYVDDMLGKYCSKVDIPTNKGEVRKNTSTEMSETDVYKETAKTGVYIVPNVFLKTDMTTLTILPRPVMPVGFKIDSLEDICAEPLQLDHLVSAFESIDVEGVDYVSKIISESRDVVNMLKVRDAILRQIEVGNYIKGDNGNNMVQQRFVYRAVSMTTSRIKPYIDTLQAEGFLTQKLHKLDGAKTVLVFEVHKEALK